MWLLSYLIFNACLYLGQLVLYTLLFLPNGNQEFLSKILFLTLCVINFSLPIILLLLFFYLSIMFAGRCLLHPPTHPPMQESKRRATQTIHPPTQ